MSSDAQLYTNSYYANHSMANSFSEFWLAAITNHRNVPIVENQDLVSRFTSKVTSGACFIGVIPAVAAEIGLATISSVGSIIMLPESTEPLEKFLAWLQSSSFGISWAVTGFVLNFSSEVLPTNENDMWDAIGEMKLYEAIHGSVDN